MNQLLNINRVAGSFKPADAQQKGSLFSRD